MEFLNNASPAIQALAAIAMLVVTIALAWFAHKTVELTRRLAEISDKQAIISAEQLHFSRHLDLESRQRKAAALGEFARRVRISMRYLDTHTPNHQLSQGFTYLTETDVAAMEHLAAEVSSDAATKCGLVSLGLRIILDQIGRFQINASWHPTTQQIDDWKQAMQMLPPEVSALEQACLNVLQEKL